MGRSLALLALLPHTGGNPTLVVSWIVLGMSYVNIIK